MSNSPKDRALLSEQMRKASRGKRAPKQEQDAAALEFLSKSRRARHKRLKAALEGKAKPPRMPRPPVRG